MTKFTLFIASYLITSSPYRFTLTFNSLKNFDLSLVYAAYLSSVFSKTSLVLSTFIYIVINKNVRSKLNIMLFYKSSYIKLLYQKEILNQMIIRSYVSSTGEKAYFRVHNLT